jgi:mutator protein MutT
MKTGKDYIGVGCGAIVINNKNEVLLLKRSENIRSNQGMWDRPGGQVEYGERVENAVIREVQEEVGITVGNLSFLKLDQDMGENKHFIAIGYLAEHISGEVENKEPHKHDEVRWFNLDNLPKNITEYTKNSIKVYVQKN